MQAQCRVTQLRGRNSRQADVDCLSLHVQAVLRHAGMRTARAEEFVAPGRTVAANHIDFTARIAERCGQVVKKVEQVRIEMPHISGAVIAQEIVKRIERLGNVLIPATINDVEPLARMSVIEAEPVFVRGWGRRFRVAVPKQGRR
jgi:hypothetical protein